MTLIRADNRQGITLVIVGAIGGLVAVITVVLRKWARMLKNTPLDGSDYLCFAALITSLTLVGSTVNTVVQGLGLPPQDLTPQQLSNFAKGMLAGIYLWTASATLVRLSMIVLYVRIFPSRTFILVCWSLFVMNLLYLFANYVAAALICKPFAYNWDQSIEGHCADRQRFYLWNGVQNLVLDVLTIVIPMPMFWNLQLPMGKKLSLTIVFAMGSGICIITLLRVIDVYRGNLQDITKDYVSVGMLSILEPLLGIISCSLPLLRPILQKISSLFVPEHLTTNNVDKSVSVLKSIGSKRIRAKVKDLYPLETFQTSQSAHTQHLDEHTLVGDGESIKGLMGHPSELHNVVAGRH